eukprot:6892126-Prymnesium_polylepis.1
MRVEGRGTFGVLSGSERGGASHLQREAADQGDARRRRVLGHRLDDRHVAALRHRRALAQEGIAAADGRERAAPLLLHGGRA